MLFVAIDDLYYPQLGWWSFIDSCLRGRLKPLTCCDFGEGSAAEKPSQQVAAAFRRLRTKTEEQEIWNHTWIYYIWTDVYWVMVIHIYIYNYIYTYINIYIYNTHVFVWHFQTWKNPATNKWWPPTIGTRKEHWPPTGRHVLFASIEHCIPHRNVNAFTGGMLTVGMRQYLRDHRNLGRTSAISEYSYLVGSIYWE